MPSPPRPALGWLTALGANDAPGASFVAFPICSVGQTPAVDGCVAITLLDAGRNPISSGTPAFVLFEGAVGHFSTYAVVIAAPPAVTVPFASFAAKAEIEDDGFELKALFTLGAGSDGIDPRTEEVSFQLGTFAITIPPGSFSFKPARPGKKGRPGKPAKFKFAGTIDGVSLEVKITQLGTDSFEFKAEGDGADLSGTANPVPIKLLSGNDGGSTQVTVKLKGGDNDEDD